MSKPPANDAPHAETGLVCQDAKVEGQRGGLDQSGSQRCLGRSDHRGATKWPRAQSFPHLFSRSSRLICDGIVGHRRTNRGWTQETRGRIDGCIIYPEDATYRRAEQTTPRQTQSETPAAAGEVRHGSKSKRRRGYGRKPRASCEVGRAAPEGHEDSSSRRRRVEPVAHIWSFRLPGAPARAEHFSSFWTSCPFRAPATRSRYCCCPQARRPEAGLG